MKAIVQFIESTDGSYGMHGQTGWDDLPYWEYCRAWIVKVNVEGFLSWGPLKYRSNCKKRHYGITEVEFYEGFLFNEKSHNKNIAEEYALSLAEELVKLGFEVNITFSENHSPQNLTKKVLWIGNIPPEFFQNKIKLLASVANLRARSGDRKI
jgi:hypothetical protein